MTSFILFFTTRRHYYYKHKVCKKYKPPDSYRLIDTFNERKRQSITQSIVSKDMCNVCTCESRAAQVNASSASLQAEINQSIELHIQHHGTLSNYSMKSRLTDQLRKHR